MSLHGSCAVTCEWIGSPKPFEGRIDGHLPLLCEISALPIYPGLISPGFTGIAALLQLSMGGVCTTAASKHGPPANVSERAAATHQTASGPQGVLGAAPTSVSSPPDIPDDALVSTSAPQDTLDGASALMSTMLSCLQRDDATPFVSAPHGAPDDASPSVSALWDRGCAPMLLKAFAESVYVKREVGGPSSSGAESDLFRVFVLRSAGAPALPLDDLLGVTKLLLGSTRTFWI